MIGRTKVKDLYRNHPVSQDDQRRILDLASDDIPDHLIARITGVQEKLVASVRQYGIVTISGLNKPERCVCGAKLVAKPCLLCQLRKMESK